jgi:twinkle protein
MFSDGHGYCFACGQYYPADGTAPVQTEVKEPTEFRPWRGKIRELAHRGLTKDTAKLFNYRQANIPKWGGYCEVANFVRDGELVAQHVRTKNKEFPWFGEKKKAGLFGQHLWRSGGKRIVVTEGEIDAMTVYEALGCKWPVVAVPSGAKDAANMFRQELEFLSSYAEVIICFDSDEAGQTATMECAAILPPGKAKIPSLPGKDPNDLWRKGERKALTDALWEAQTYRPDGIISVADVDDTEEEQQDLWLFPWRFLTVGLMGQRSGEITMWTAGTGLGKSTVMREMAYAHLMDGRPVGMIMLEESVRETTDDLISLLIGKPVRQIRAARRLNQLLRDQGQDAEDFGIVDDLTDEEYQEAKLHLKSLPLYFYNHEGVNDFDDILGKIEYMGVSLDCPVVILDHVTAVVAGRGDHGGNERLAIDDLMHNSRSLVERTGIHLDVVSHLRKPNGQPFEEGGQIALDDLRGSGSLKTVPNTIVGLERDQQATDPELASLTRFRGLKGRFKGSRLGILGALAYDNTTGRLVEADLNQYTEAGDTLVDETPEEIDLDDE